MANTFGPDGLQQFNQDFAGILSLKLPNNNIRRISTEELADFSLIFPETQLNPVKEIFLRYSSSAAYENVGIVYAKKGDTFYEVCQMGYVPPRDPLSKTISINKMQWNQAANQGGTDPDNKIYFVFAAWHRVNPGDEASPWIQNKIRVVNGNNGEVFSNLNFTPSMNSFSFEDLTGDGETSDEDYDDMLITVTFNY